MYNLTNIPATTIITEISKQLTQLMFIEQNTPRDHWAQLLKFHRLHYLIKLQQSIEM